MSVQDINQNIVDHPPLLDVILGSSYFPRMHNWPCGSMQSKVSSMSRAARPCGLGAKAAKGGIKPSCAIQGRSAGGRSVSTSGMHTETCPIAKRTSPLLCNEGAGLLVSKHVQLRQPWL